MGQKSKKKINKPYITKPGEIFKDLGFSEAESQQLLIKSDLLVAIDEIIKKNNYTSKQLEKILKKPQPRISELVNGKINTMTIDKLIEYLANLGAKVSLSVK